MLEVNKMVDTGVGRNLLAQQAPPPAAPQQPVMQQSQGVQNNLAPPPQPGRMNGQIADMAMTPPLGAAPPAPEQQSQLQQQLATYKSLREDNKIDDAEYGKLVTTALTSSNAQAGAELEQFGKLTEMVKKGGGPAKFGELVNSGFFDGIAPPATLQKLKSIDYSKMKAEADFTEYELPSGVKLVSGRDADGKPYIHVLPTTKEPTSPESGYYDGLKSTLNGIKRKLSLKRVNR